MVVSKSCAQRLAGNTLMANGAYGSAMAILETLRDTLPKS